MEKLRSYKIKNFDRYDAADIILKTFMIFICIFSLLALILPSLLVVIMSFNAGEYITFPPQGFSLRWYREMVNDWEIVSAAKVSLKSAAIVVIIDILLGVPAAWVLVRHRFRGSDLINSFIMTPLMLPGIVIGIGFLFFISLLGFQISFTTMVLSHVVVTLPYIVRLTMSRLINLDPRLEEASANLGASTIQTLWYIVLPKLIGGILAGAAFAFLMSFDNLTVSLFTASVRDRPLPLQVMYLLRFDVNPVVAAISSIEIFLAVLVIVAGNGMGGGSFALVGGETKK